MTDFSATDAAFTGFRLVRENPRAVAVWAVVQIAISLGFGVLLALTAGSALMAIQSQGFAKQDPAQVMATFRQLLPMYAAIAVFAVVFYPVLYAAMARAVLKPDDDRFGYLRLGRDELRQLGLLLLFGLLGFGFYLLLIVMIVVVSLVAKGGAAAVAGVLVALIGFFGIVAAWIVVGVRLSLASPMTFASERIDLFGSWALTKGRFWSILGTYLLTWALAALIYMLGFAVIAAFAALAGGGMRGLGELFHPDLGSLAAFVSPARLIQVVLSGVLTALIWPVVMTPPAAIYRALAPAPIQRRVGEIFS
ncbi:MAG TPA: hypothetical protein VII63_02175 [Caulobacteraceae bacterium]